MQRLSRNAPCPCGSGRRAKSCCEPIIDGEPASSPEALMRSRYTAYAVRAVQHLMRTTAAEGPHFVADADAWAKELREYCSAVDFQGLQVLSASESGEEGAVSFRARLRAGKQDLSFGEASRFVRHGGRWFYLDGERLDTP